MTKKMTTANDLITQAAEMIGATSTVNPLAPSSIQRMFTILLQFLDNLESNNTIIGLVIPTKLADNLEEPGYATEMLINNLAVKSAPALRLSASMDVKLLAGQLMQDVMRRDNPRPQQPYPDNLPLGKGNNTGPRGRRYWPVPNNIDTESGSPITVEDASNT